MGGRRAEERDGEEGSEKRRKGVGGMMTEERGRGGYNGSREGGGGGMREGRVAAGLMHAKPC